MKLNRMLVLSLILFVFSLCTVNVYAAVSNVETQETLTLKRDLLVERVMRYQTSLQLMNRDARQMLQDIEVMKKEIEELNVKLKVYEKKEGK